MARIPDEVTEQATKEDTVDEPVNEPPATPLPRTARSVEAIVREGEVAITLGGDPRHPASGSHQAIHGQTRNYRIPGLDKNLSYEQLKVTVLAGCGDDLHVDTLDLYQAKARSAFIRQAGVELGIEERVIKRDLGSVLMKLEQLQAERIDTARNATESVGASDFRGKLYR